MFRSGGKIWMEMKRRMEPADQLFAICIVFSLLLQGLVRSSGALTKEARIKLSNTIWPGFLFRAT